MKDSYKLSVIIPCYNSASLLINNLRQMEDSIDENVEIVIVDDCSTDGSFEALKNYADTTKIDISLYKNTNNHGPGETRNNGVLFSKGEYITFMDSDDYFENRFFGLMNDLLKDSKIDCILFNYFTVHEKKESNSVFFSNNINCERKKDILVFIKGAPWGKVYKRNVIIENDIKFLNCKRNEDLPFTKIAISKCMSFKVINEPLYNYVQLQTSLMHNSSLLNPKNAQIAFDYIETKLEEEYREEIKAIFALEYLYSTGLTNSIIMRRREWKRYIHEAINKYPDYKKSAYIKRYTFKIRFILFLIRKRAYLFIRFLKKHFN